MPIGSVTNGVHAPTWISPELDDVLARRVLPEWDGAPASDWVRIDEAGNDELWRALQQGRERLVTFVRGRLRRSRLAQGFSASDVAWTNGVLDPSVLTVGFARRFATYKRGTLLLSQPDRLRALLFHPERPVQFVFAGKAHPADQPGKEMIQRIQHFAAQHEVRHRFVFLDDYDMAVARALYQGSDVWLNTPRRPQEACGTSGMKAALNGSLNCSILDGWWDECFDGQNGWAITSAEDEPDLDRRDQLEAESVFDLLESQIVPLFYDRGPGGVAVGWVSRVKDALHVARPEGHGQSHGARLRGGVLRASRRSGGRGRRGRRGEGPGSGGVAGTGQRGVGRREGGRRRGRQRPGPVGRGASHHRDRGPRLARARRRRRPGAPRTRRRGRRDPAARAARPGPGRDRRSRAGPLDGVDPVQPPGATASRSGWSPTTPTWPRPSSWAS